MNITVTEIIVLLGGWTVIVAGLVIWIGKLVAEKVTLKWKEQQQKEIETLRSELTRDRIAMETAISSFSSGQIAVQEKKIQATEKLWKRVLKIRKVCQSVIFFYSIHHPSEYNEVFVKPNMKAMISNLDDSIIDQISFDTEDFESNRPFLGEKLWLLFFIYRAFLGRITLILVDGLKEEKIKDWREDHGVNSLLKYVLSNEQITAVTVDSPIAMHKAITLLEAMLLEEISLIVSGSKASKDTFELAKKLGELTGKMVETKK
ncbi:hypothetical protein LCGC14_2692840 [marine sediment metagenome]|uniref:Uncharacterized protein n=1 Tax=marine sediment metagenome TaxID=412755 RepID=A0A0F8ZI18_9ZZZZ